MDKVGAIDDTKSFAHVVIGDYNTDPFRFEIEDYTLHLRNRDGVDGGEWFVEQQKFRLGDEGSSDF